MSETIFFVISGICLVTLITILIYGCRKNANGRDKIVCCIIGTMCVIVPIVTLLLVFSPNNQAPNTEETSNITIVDKEVTFDEIYTAFEENEINAQDKYNGNRYIITAEINGMKTGGVLGLEENITTLTMETKVNNTVVFFLARFDESQRESLKSVKVGDTITFVGKCNDGTFSECELKNEV